MTDGRLLFSRVVSDLGEVLERALSARVTGRATVEPQDALLLDAAGRGVLAFERGVPVAARHTETGRMGREALAELSIPGPCRVELYEVERTPTLAEVPEARIPPWLPAELLAGDEHLANRVRRAAADRETGRSSDPDALASFLRDRERIRAIQREARREAASRAQEWGLEDVLAEEPDATAGHSGDGTADGPDGVESGTVPDARSRPADGDDGPRPMGGDG